MMNTTSEEKIRQIRELQAMGLPIEAITRRLHVSSRTIYKYGLHNTKPARGGGKHKSNWPEWGQWRELNRRYGRYVG